MGAGIAKDFERGAYWYRKSAEQGNQWGQLGFGHCYFYGLGVEKDRDRAAYWYRKSAAQGNATARRELSNMGLDY